MKKLYYYLLVCLALSANLIDNNLLAQSCSSLQATTTSFESRCTSTGSIAVNVTGGSGNYNYKAIGPLSTPFTSASTITGLRPGTYRVVVKDINTGCETIRENVEVPGTYSDPRFGLDKTNVTCAGNDGTISVTNLQFGRNPFTYSIIAPSPAGVGTTNSTGNFTNLVAGEYYIQLRDSCGGIQVRRATVEQYNWWFGAITVNRVGCDSADAFISLSDNRGASNTSGAAFSGFTYGVVRAAGDTSWYPSNSFRFFLGNRRSVTIIAKDDCGTIHSTVWTLPANRRPSVTGVDLTNFTCSTFTADVTGEQNLTAPEYCLYTSTNVFIDCNYTGYFGLLAYGSYCIRINDVCYDTTIVRCFTATPPAPGVGSSVGISAQTCSTFTATINGQSNLTNPDYCLYDIADALISCNNTGVFPNLQYGSYCIKIEDNCVDTVITRCFTATPPIPVLNVPVISGSTCGTFNVSAGGSGLINPRYCLYDSDGNLVSCDSSGNFTGVPHGSYCIRAIACGDTTAPRCFSTGPPVPSVAAAVQISNRTCTTFTATINGQTNLSAPQFCLFDNTNTQVSCNTTGVFPGIPYGAYCIRIKDSCTDSTITRCFTATRTLPSVNATMQQTNSTCSTFSARVTGSNLASSQYCLYDSLDVLVRCNTSGLFDGLTYGRYCVRVESACGDTFKVCQTFVPAKGLTITTAKSCNIGNASINVEFSSNNAPFIVRILHPRGETVFTDTSNTDPVQAILPALPPGLSYKVYGQDACGQLDSGFIVPDASIVTRSVTAISKCPSSTWANGSGNLSVTCSSNLYTIRPVIIKKNGANFNLSHSSNSGSNYLFNDLEPATYVVEYTVSTCNTRIYDTFAIQPYSYPTQGQSAIYQCDDNSFSLGADVSGGVSPYTYQIIGSMPETPSIISATQTNPIFSINNGTTYSLVRLRTIDACGNATLSDLSVLPLQNISITTTSQCYYDTVTMSVDPIANATYEWYKKRNAVDSILVSTEPSYMIPFFEPEHTAEYVCKVTVNNGCLIRLTYFDLAEDCDHITLPTEVTLSGKSEGASNRLSWQTVDDREVQAYVVERRSQGAGSFRAIGTVQSRKVKNSALYLYNDAHPAPGDNQYRLRLIHNNGKTDYSNIVRIGNGNHQSLVYPNPASDLLQIALNGTAPANYELTLLSAGGQVVYRTVLKGITRTIVPYQRGKLAPGIYLLHIRNLTSGTTEQHKVIFR